MAIDLDKQYGPFSLKIWLIIGIGGIGIGLFVASKQKRSSGGITSDKGIAAPPVIFSKVIIGLEHVPEVNTQQIAYLKPEPAQPLMKTGYMSPGTTIIPASITPSSAPKPLPNLRFDLPFNAPTYNYQANPLHDYLTGNVGLQYVPTPGNTTLTGGYIQKIPQVK